MIKMELSAILYSKKNYDLGYKVHNVCRAFSINLITALDFVELTIKTMEIKPQIIFCDCETMDFSSSTINAFLEREEFKKVKIIFVGNEETTKNFKNYICKNLMISNAANIKNVITELQSDLYFESYEEKLKDKAFCDLDIKINNLLAELGFSLKYSGCAFLKLAIKNAVANNGVIHSLSTNEYPYIASIYKTGCANVERNIRNAIQNAWITYGKSKWNNVFYSKWLENGKKPTNREFIFMCCDLLISQYNSKIATVYWYL